MIYYHDTHYNVNTGGNFMTNRNKHKKIFHTNDLDLHGVKHDEVERMVENYILLNKPPMSIVTGNSDKMKELVENVLNKHKMKFDRFKPSRMTILK